MTSLYFNQQKSTINQLESEKTRSIKTATAQHVVKKIKSEKEAIESQSSYCNRQLRSKQSEIYWDKNFSGPYHLVEFYNDRPAYKVSFFIDKKMQMSNCNIFNK